MHRLIPLEPCCDWDDDNCICGVNAGGGPIGIGVFPPGCGPPGNVCGGPPGNGLLPPPGGGGGPPGRGGFIGNGLG